MTAHLHDHTLCHNVDGSLLLLWNNEHRAHNIHEHTCCAYINSAYDVIENRW